MCRKGRNVGCVEMVVKRSWSGWRELAFLILLLAFGLRMVNLQSRALWYDEAFAVLYASLSPARIVYGTVTPVAGAGAADVHPLLYYFLLHGWMGLVGRSPLAVRFLSVLLGMLTVALLWRLAARCFDRRAGLVVGMLAAANPFHVAYSQEARMYALLALAAVMAAWALLRALEEAGERRSRGAEEQGREGAGEQRGRGGAETQRRGDGHTAVSNKRYVIRRCLWVIVHWSFYAVAAALTLYAHNLGAFVLAALNLLVVTRRRWWHRLPALALADLGALALFSPWLIAVLPGQIGFVRRGYWLAPPGADELIRAVMLPVLTFYEEAPFWLLGVGLLTGLLLLALLVLRVRRTRALAGRFLFLWWAPVGLLWLVSQWRPLYLERALLPSALFCLVAVGWLFARGGLPRPVNWVLIALLAVSTAGSLTVHYAYVGFPRPPFQEAVAYLRARVGPGDAVVHTNKLTYFPMRYYASDVAGVFLADPPGSPQDTLADPTQEALGIFATSSITEAIGTAEQIWLVYFPREVEETQALGVEHPALIWLEGRFSEMGRERFGDLVVAFYRREEP